MQSSTNHLITGRRGVGKSTTLAVLQRQAELEGAHVIFVDVETHKARSYPDVLIEMVLEILRAIEPSRWTWKPIDRKLRRQVIELSQVLSALRDAAPEVTSTSESMQHRESNTSVKLTGGVAKRYAKLSASARGVKTSRTTSSAASKQTRRKEEFLRDLAPEISSALEVAAKMNGRKSLLLVLDDFYFIAKDTQPLVLDHLHGITKRSNVWLKIGSVHSRTQSYADGDPPLGMQPPHDLQHLSLDVGLTDFATAQTFLEEVTNGILSPLGFKLREILTQKARERAVLIAGGAVARDYFDLLIASADAAWEATQRSSDPNLTFKIDAEHVQAAAGLRLDRKQTDLRNDAGRDAPQLESRFSDLVAFARDRETYFFLVRRDQIDSDWGHEIVELEDLRFVYRIMTTRPNSRALRGVDTIVFMVDIPALVSRRMRKAPVEFWKPGKADQLRKAQWVYEPGWTALPRQAAKVASETRHSPSIEVPELPFD
ncbi:hypothetical protein GS446_21365 [Rhodococcus hoagii]|nr:hypothetical protein [Prescottella equi]